MSHELTAYLSIFNLFKLNELWPYYQKHVNQIILNRTTLWSLALRIFEAFVWILLIVNLSLNQTLLTFLLYVRQTWMTQLIIEISLWEVPLIRKNLPLIWKDFSAHMHGLRVYMKEGLPFAWDLSLENSAGFYLRFWLALLFQCLTSFSSNDHLLLHSFWFYFI